MATEASQDQPVDLASLSTAQLSQVKKQLDTELEHLTTSFAQLRAAQAKFKECVLNTAKISEGRGAKTPANQILVPLTSSLYVPGTLSDTEHVIVDVGTGFYVEKTTKEATEFYNTKIADLAVNLKDLESIVQGKSNNLRVVEDVLRQKVVGSGGTNPQTTT